MLFFFNNINYHFFLVYVLVVFVFVVGLFLVSYYWTYKTVDAEKLSAYECGFDPFEESMGRFDIKFYIVAILFLIFDLEIVFLFPWSIMMYKLPMFSFWVVVYFLYILIVGFIYEWKKGALDWN